jgi:CheY-like chemotaxis protein
MEMCPQPYRSILFEEPFQAIGVVPQCAYDTHATPKTRRSSLFPMLLRSECPIKRRSITDVQFGTEDKHGAQRFGSVIAIVDDDESVCRAIKRLVRSAGMDANTFTSGEEFLRLFHAVPFTQCVVLDIYMPGLNGLQVQAKLAAGGSAVPVVVMTGNDAPELREKAFAAGAVACLEKPFNSESLLNALGAATKLGS